MKDIRSRNAWIALSSLVLGVSDRKPQLEQRQEEAANSLSRFAPLAPIRVFRPNPNLEIAFDVRTRNPVYVLERLDHGFLTKKRKNRRQRRPRFYEEQDLPEMFRARNSSYHLSGWDRGHMAPAADFGDDYIHTFSLCNVSPQHPSLNRSLWTKLEQWTRRKVIASRFSTAYVVTGPLWLPESQQNETEFLYQYPAIGKPPWVVHVPTHFFKVVVVVDGNELVQSYACFVVINGTEATGKTLEDCLVAWSDLEAVTGLVFFPELLAEEWKRQADRCLDRVKSLPPDSTFYEKRLVRKSSIEHLCADGTCR
jgi:DNA/RNA endonuclease G (NUC1)